MGDLLRRGCELRWRSNQVDEKSSISQMSYHISDLIRGRRRRSIDAEHPTFIPMYTPTTLHVPRIQNMRPQLFAIGRKVNSLLSELPLYMHETWQLPKFEMLCMIRYQADPPEDAHEDGQVPKSTDEVNQWKEPRVSPRPRTSRPHQGKELVTLLYRP